MIIGNNTNFNQNQFNHKLNNIKTNSENTRNKVNPTMVDRNALNFQNTNNKDQMTDKSFAMLQDRLNHGLISLDEFTKMCEKIRKQRRN